MARPSSCAALQAGAVAVVTGASSGIGKAAALKFAKMGLKVCLADNDQVSCSTLGTAPRDSEGRTF